jgi:ribonuclease Z
MRREKPLQIYGPIGLVDYIRAFSETLGGPTFPVILNEINMPGIIFESDDYKIIAVEADHIETAWSYGLFESPRPGKFYPEKARQLGIPKGVLWGKLQRGETIEYDGKKITPSQVSDPQRLGRKIVYSGDTAPNKELLNIAKEVDLLILEATFLDELSDRAMEDGHTTALQAAQIAKEARVDLLVLTHISSRYPDSSVLRAEAKKVFNKVVVAEDLMELEISLK